MSGDDTSKDGALLVREQGPLLATAPLPKPYPRPATGAPAVVSSLRFALERSGVRRGAHVLRQVNQKEGFDCPGCAWPDPDHRSVAEFCENGARAVAHEADHRRVDAAFFAAHSVAALREQSDFWLERQGRLTEPMVLEKGASHYTPITWEDAFARLGAALRALPSPDAAAFYTSGRASNEAAFLYQLFARSFGTNNLPDCSNMCHESSGKALGSTLGVGKGTVQLADFAQADLILILGQNPGTNHPRMLSTLQEAAKRGCMIVSANPLYERALEEFAHPQHVTGLLGLGTKLTSHYLQVKIGGDVALLKGIMKAVLALDAETGGKVLDRRFLDEHTVGFEALRADLEETGWDDVESSSGIARARIEEIGALYAKSERVIACWAMGLTQHKNAVANIRSVVNLLALRGNLGRPGAGVCPVRGHSNVQGDRTMGIWEAPPPAFLDRLDAGAGITSPRAHGLDVVATIRAMRDGDVKVFVALGGNFAAATPDTAVTAQALARCTLTAHVATKLNRSHLEHGEVALLLPCLGRTERDLQAGKPQFVTVENSMGVVHRSKGRLPPASAVLRSEPSIVASLARATLGPAHPIPWEELAGDYNKIRDLIERSIAGFERFNERVRHTDGFVLENAVRKREWNTKSKRVELTVHPLPDLGLRDGELVLMTIRTHDQFNTTIYEENDRYRGVYGERRVILVNPADLAARGLRDTDLVDVTSRFTTPDGDERRTVTRFKLVPYDIPRGCVAAYFPETNPLVPLDSVADESHTPTSKSILVTLTKSAPA